MNDNQKEALDFIKFTFHFFLCFVYMMWMGGGALLFLPLDIITLFKYGFSLKHMHKMDRKLMDLV